VRGELDMCGSDSKHLFLLSSFCHRFLECSEGENRKEMGEERRMERGGEVEGETV
jgi:hypothetical protein